MKNKLLIIRIKGGLGNQLFQFNLGEYIRTNYEIDIKYDIKTGYVNDAFNRSVCFESIFGNNKNLIYSGIFNKVSLLRFLKYYTFIFNKSFLNYLFLEEEKNISKEVLFNLINKSSNNIILEGYWQYLSLVNSKFIDKLNRSIIAPIINYSQNDLIVHYRSDNFSDSLNFEYFETSIIFMLNKYPNINNIIIYSDSKKVLNLLKYLKNKFDIKIEVDFNDYDPFFLMSTVSRSKYFIPSNGTFSLWSILLGENRFILLPPTLRSKDLSNFNNYFLTGSE